MAYRNLTEKFDLYRSRRNQEHKDVQITISSDNHDNKYVLEPEWVDHVDKIQESIRSIDNKLKNLEILYAGESKDIFRDDTKKYTQNINELIDSITKDFRTAEYNLKKIGSKKDENLTNKERQIRINVIRNFGQIIQNKSANFRRLQKEHTAQLQKRDEISSNYKIENESDESAVELLESKELEQLQQMRQNTATRSQEIQKIAQSVQEIAELFQQLNVLVIEQGSMIDRIDYNIENSLEHVKIANVELQKAERYSRSTKSWACICILVLILMILVLILIYKHSN
jgi:syntaxin 16